MKTLDPSAGASYPIAKPFHIIDRDQEQGYHLISEINCNTVIAKQTFEQLPSHLNQAGQTIPPLYNHELRRSDDYRGLGLGVLMIACGFFIQVFVFKQGFWNLAPYLIMGAGIYVALRHFVVST